MPSSWSMAALRYLKMNVLQGLFFLREENPVALIGSPGSGRSLPNLQSSFGVSEREEATQRRGQDHCEDKERTRWCG